MGSLEDIRRAYDTVANTYAAYFPTTEPEQTIELAMLDYFVGQTARLIRDQVGTEREEQAVLIARAV